MTLKLYYVGEADIVVATSEGEALKLLNKEEDSNYSSEDMDIWPISDSDLDSQVGDEWDIEFYQGDVHPTFRELLAEHLEPAYLMKKI